MGGKMASQLNSVIGNILSNNSSPPGLGQGFYVVAKYDPRLIIGDEALKRFPPDHYIFIDSSIPGIQTTHVAIPMGNKWTIKTSDQSKETTSPADLIGMTMNLVFMPIGILQKLIMPVINALTGRSNDITYGTTYWVRPEYAPKREWATDVTGHSALEPVYDYR
jgi:hypothetical protein